MNEQQPIPLQVLAARNVSAAPDTPVLDVYPSRIPGPRCLAERCRIGYYTLAQLAEALRTCPFSVEERKEVLTWARRAYR